MVKLNEIKSMAIIALPLMAAFLAQKSMRLIDTIMMGWIGPDALAAGALGTSVFTTATIFCMGTLTAVGVFIAHAKGANDIKDIQLSMEHGLCLALMLSVPCMLTVWFTPLILSLIGQPGVVVQNTSLLLHGLTWGIPGILLFFVFREFISAFSLTRVVMFVVLGSVPLTFTANYVLIYGKFGFPQLGIAGIGYAGSLVMWLMFLTLFIYTKKHPLLKKYMHLSGFKFDFNKLYNMFFVGISSGAFMLIEGGMFLLSAIMMGYFGVVALASHQIAMQCVSLAYAVPFALGMATALKVGHEVGSNNMLAVKRSSLLGIVLGLILTIAIVIIFIFLPEVLVNIFIKPYEPNYQEIKQLSRSFLFLAGLFLFFDALQAIVIGALRGLKDTFIPMLLSIFCYFFVGILSGYFLAFQTSLGEKGIWYGLTFGLCSISVLVTIRFMKHLKYANKHFIR
jgi:MATE family multidrug resistance protein